MPRLTNVEVASRLIRVISARGSHTFGNLRLIRLPQGQGYQLRSYDTTILAGECSCQCDMRLVNEGGTDSATTTRHRAIAREMMRIAGREVPPLPARTRARSAPTLAQQLVAAFQARQSCTVGPCTLRVTESSSDARHARWNVRHTATGLMLGEGTPYYGGFLHTVYQHPAQAEMRALYAAQLLLNASSLEGWDTRAGAAPTIADAGRPVRARREAPFRFCTPTDLRDTA